MGEVVAELSLACLFCAGPISEDQGDYCTDECSELHCAEQVARLGGRPREARCGHLVPSHPGRQRRACDPCRSAKGESAQTWTITCRGCGREAAVGHQAQLYCTATCHDETLRNKRWAEIDARRVNKACVTCGVSLAGRRAQRFCSVVCGDVARGHRLLGPPPTRTCVLDDCDVEFQPRKTSQRACCEAHGKKLWNRENPEPWNDRKRDHYHRRRALKAAASTGRPVLLSEIRVRDGNRCHLCLKAVPEKAWPHPMSPSLDHVVPLSKGGTHDPDNVKLAHLECNTAKGNRGGNEQLLLIG